MELIARWKALLHAKHEAPCQSSTAASPAKRPRVEAASVERSSLDLRVSSRSSTSVASSCNSPGDSIQSSRSPTGSAVPKHGAADDPLKERREALRRGGQKQLLKEVVNYLRTQSVSGSAGLAAINHHIKKIWYPPGVKWSESTMVHGSWKTQAPREGDPPVVGKKFAERNSDVFSISCQAIQRRKNKNNVRNGPRYGAFLSYTLKLRKSFLKKAQSSESSKA